jgi:hypothetical protein
MLNQLWPRHTDVHVFIGVIHWWFGSAMSHVFCSKDVMDERAYTGVEMSVSPLSVIKTIACSHICSMLLTDGGNCF